MKCAKKKSFKYTFRGYKPKGFYAPVVTRRRLLAAFSTPYLSYEDTKQIVSRYIDNCVVPPTWSDNGVNCIFGPRIRRLWRRYVKSLRCASYMDPQTGRFLFPATQTVYDFGMTLEESRLLTKEKKNYFVIDEFWFMFSENIDAARNLVNKNNV